MAYLCTDTIAKNVVSNCTTAKVGGLEVKAWVFSRPAYANSFTFDATYPNKVTNIASVALTKCFTITGVKKLLNAGHDLVAADDRPDKYTHYAAFQQFELLAEDIANLDSAKDIFIIFERKDKGTGGDGTFVGYGLKNGLFKSTDTRRANDINGARSLEFASMGGSEENVSEYSILKTSYADTLAMLVALETVPT